MAGEGLQCEKEFNNPSLSRVIGRKCRTEAYDGRKQWRNVVSGTGHYAGLVFFFLGQMAGDWPFHQLVMFPVCILCDSGVDVDGELVGS